MLLNDIPLDKYAVKVEKGNETFGQLPCEFPRIAWHFLARSENISVEMIGHRRHCKQLCGEIEISCQLEFSFSNKVQMNCLKEVLPVYYLKMQTNCSYRFLELKRFSVNL